MSEYVYNAAGICRRKCRCPDRDKFRLARGMRETGLHLPVKCCAKYCPDYIAVGAHVLRIAAHFESGSNPALLTAVRQP